MFGKKFLVVVAVALLLATFVAPAMVTLPGAGHVASMQTVTWSVPGGIHPDGGCEIPTAHECPPPR